MNGYYIRHDKVTRLFLLCWLAYFAANMARLSYGTAMAEILRAEGFDNTSGGLVSTGFFICYGIGQLISGYLGDKTSPRWMVGVGLLLTGICNLLMALAVTSRQMLVIWCVNGAVQSTLWPPILRVIAEYFAPEYRKKACVNMATTYPVATLLSYALCAGVIALLGWRPYFYMDALFLAAVSLAWMIAFGRFDAYRTVPARDEALPVAAEGEAPETPPATRLPWMVILLFCAALMMQGMLRDGLMTWVPTYLSSTFQLGSSVAILISAVLPALNLAGVYATNAIYRRLRSEATVSALLFVLSALAALCLALFGSGSMVLSLACFAIVTACMMGINLMFVSFVPTYFAGMRKVSFMTGLTNSMVYVGSSMATYGIGAIADHFGWPAMLVTLIAVATVGLVLCVLSIVPWKRYLASQ